MIGLHPDRRVAETPPLPPNLILDYPPKKTRRPLPTNGITSACYVLQGITVKRCHTSY